MLLLIIPVLGAAMGVYLCYELLWALRSVVNVKSSSSTVCIMRVKHLASDKGGTLLSYLSLAISK